VHGIDRYLDDPGKGVHEPAAAVFMMRVEHGVCFEKRRIVYEAKPKRCFTSA
jgi:hypothetical protein